MYLKKVTIFFHFVIIVLFLDINFCCSEEPVLRVGYQDNDGFPLVMGSGPKPGNPAGIGVDIISQVAKDLNIKLLITRMPNRRVHDSLRLGKFDGSGFYSFSKDRLKEGVYPIKDGKLDKSKRVYVLSYYLYVLKGSSVSWDGKKITGITSVGANMGYSVVGNLKALGIPVHEVKSTKQNLEMLLLDRNDAYAAQDGTLDPIIATYEKYQNLIKIGPPIKTKEYYFMFSHQYYKKNKELAHKIWDRIEEVRDSVISNYKKVKFKPVIE